MGDAISDRTAKAKNKVVAIGVAPWGIVERKEDLVGRDVSTKMHTMFQDSMKFLCSNL